MCVCVSVCVCVRERERGRERERAKPRRDSHRTPAMAAFLLSLHFHPGVNRKSISHRCHLREVAFERELIVETIYLPLGCLQGGQDLQSIFKVEKRVRTPRCPLCGDKEVSESANPHIENGQVLPDRVFLSNIHSFYYETVFLLRSIVFPSRKIIFPLSLYQRPGRYPGEIAVETFFLFLFFFLTSLKPRAG